MMMMMMILSNLCTVITLKIWGGGWARLGGLCPLAPA